jgi:mutual gliding-motility protein MglA
MALVNYSTREITCKIVYYGPARSGKTTNLHYLHANLPESVRGPIVSLATEGDRTLFFDYLPVDLGAVSDFRIRLQLYTVPGQVYYDSTRRLVLQGADGVVFIADSSPDRQADNLESFRNLQANLLDQGVDPRSLPVCIQFNKRDRPDAAPMAEIEAALNFRRAPSHEAAAVHGAGVFETLQSIIQMVVGRLSERGAGGATGSAVKGRDDA